MQREASLVVGDDHRGPGEVCQLPVDIVLPDYETDGDNEAGGEEDQAEKLKVKTKKPKEEQLKIDIQKCDYYGTCPVV